jgi:long-chain acyl-CoA synthetase
MTLALDAAMRDLLADDPVSPYIEAHGRWIAKGKVRAVADAVLDRIQAAGIPRGAPIGLIARNRTAHVAALFGLLSRRRHVVMLHAYQAREKLAAEIAGLAMAAVIGAESDWDDALRDGVAGAGMLGIMLGDDPDLTVSTMAGTGFAPRDFTAADTAIEMLTSGTTGAPKRVPISYATLAAAVEDAALATTQAGTVDTAAPFVQFYPLGNISGLFGLITCAVRGQPVVLLEKFEVATWVDAVQRHRPSAFMSLPPAALRMVLDADVPKEALSSIPVLRCGSAPLDPALQQSFEDRYGIPILINYGATEFCGVIANWTLADHRTFGAAKRGSVGRARPGIGLRVTDPDTRETMPQGDAGRLEVLAERIAPDWVQTTDLAVIDDDGFVFLKGRTDSVINRGGFKISPEAVAAILRSHPAVEDASVVGLPDDRLGEVPVAAIELRDGFATPEQDLLAGAVRNAISAQAVPVRISILDRLPRTGSMKVDRAALARLLMETPA